MAPANKSTKDATKITRVLLLIALLPIDLPVGVLSVTIADEKGILQQQPRSSLCAALREIAAYETLRNQMDGRAKSSRRLTPDAQNA
jgi:hypothetical protein